LSTIFAKTVFRYLPICDELIAVVYRRFACSSVVCRATVRMGRRGPSVRPYLKVESST
jgi:hypothetical protein